MCVFVQWSPGWAIWLNYEVVDFQSSVSDCYILRLCHLLLTTFIYNLLTHLSQPFLDISIFPPTPTAPPSSAVLCRNTYLSVHPLPTSSTGAERHPPGHCSWISPASLHRLFLRPAPASDSISRVCPPPFAALSLHPVPVGPWEVHMFWGPLSPCVSASTSLCVIPSPGIFWFMISFLLDKRFRARARGQGASTTW